MNEIKNDVSKNYSYENIKSKYILKKIFDNLKEAKCLYIIKSCKKIQNKLEITLDNYKNYAKIEIEIIPIEWDTHSCKSKHFINIPLDQEDYFHIYINDSKNQTYYNKINETTKKINVRIDRQVKSLKELFKYCDSIKKINFIRFTIYDIINMESMFSECTSLEELIITNFKTDNVKNMSKMFWNCSSLKYLDISNMKSDNVEDISYMFSGCKKIKKIECI